jgi:SprA-related family
MNSVGIGTTPAYANLVTPFSPVTKQAVGLENAAAKEEALAPVVELGKSSQTFNRESKKIELPQLLGNENDTDTVVADDDAEASQEQRGEARRQEQETRQQEVVDNELIRELAARDREVRAHEQAHAAVGGQFAGSPSFSFQRGPDGVNYAIGGEVPISLPGSGDDPKANLSAADQVRRAALAPAEPSAQDQRVAAQASQLALEARSDIVEFEAQQRLQETEQEGAEKAKQSEAEKAEQERQRVEEETRRQEELLAESRRRALELSDQLITDSSVDSDQAVGSFLDQQA